MEENALERRECAGSLDGPAGEEMGRTASARRTLGSPNRAAGVNLMSERRGAAMVKMGQKRSCRELYLGQFGGDEQYKQRNEGH